jgi:S1-C subfamily serine protease
MHTADRRMTRRMCTAIVVAAALWLPLRFAAPTATAVPRPAPPRLAPNAVSAMPSYVRRIEPAVVGLRVKARADAPSSQRLGARRAGSAVIFDARGYAVTVTYLIVDAESIEAQLRDGRLVRAEVTGMDLESGLAVVRLAGNGPWPVASLGDSRDLLTGARTGTVAVDEDDDLVHTASTIEGVRRFSASWEYMLDRAFIVAPAISSWGGSALVDEQGRLVGIVSLRLGDAPHVNLAIPLETFVPVKDELIAAGRVTSRRPRPWLGLLTIGGDDGIVVDGFNDAGPARAAGFRRGDRIVGVDGVRVATQEEFYERLWRRRAGDTIDVAVRRGDTERVISVRSVDRYTLYRSTSH